MVYYVASVACAAIIYELYWNTDLRPAISIHSHFSCKLRDEGLYRKSLITSQTQKKKKGEFLHG